MDPPPPCAAVRPSSPDRTRRELADEHRATGLSQKNDRPAARKQDGAVKEQIVPEHSTIHRTQRAQAPRGIAVRAAYRRVLDFLRGSPARRRQPARTSTVPPRGSRIVRLADVDPETASGAREQRLRRAHTTCLADVALAHIEWLWQGRIPLGAVTILDGDPDLGKSTVTLDMAARVSTGRNRPDGSPGISAANVIVVTYEDHLAATIRPRLHAAGAELSRVHALSITTEHGEDGPELPTDLAALAEKIREKRAKLVIIDPLMAALGGSVDAHRDQDVRRVLAPLARIAEEHGCAVVAVRHLRKGGGANPLHAGGGSIGIIGAARSALLVARDPQDPERRVLARTKCNLSAPVPSLGFRFVSRGEVARVEWLGPVDATAGELLAAPSGPTRRPRDEAEEWLRERLADGPVTVPELQAQAQAAGHAWRTVERAKRSLGVLAERVNGFGSAGHWTWSLTPPDDHVRESGGLSSEEPRECVSASPTRGRGGLSDEAAASEEEGRGVSARGHRAGLASARSVLCG